MGRGRWLSLCPNVNFVNNSRQGLQPSLLVCADILRGLLGGRAVSRMPLVYNIAAIFLHARLQYKGHCGLEILTLQPRRIEHHENQPQWVPSPLGWQKTTLLWHQFQELPAVPAQQAEQATAESTPKSQRTLWPKFPHSCSYVAATLKQSVKNCASSPDFDPWVGPRFFSW